jgi:glycosyltransferase involved in cell wall biosynthesis
MKKILFIIPYRKDSAPSQRFRFEQYLDFLNENGFESTLSPLIATAAEDALLNGSNSIRKVIIGVHMGMRRLRDLFRMNQYDIIFIAREGFITGSIFFEKSLKKSRAKIVYDFDDAIWIDVISEKNRSFAWLKNAGKTKKIISLADIVVGGNKYLAQYALQFNKNVTVLPTTIDTDLYQPGYTLHDDPVVIGWSGSRTTIEHFKTALPALTILKKKYGKKISFRVIGDGDFKDEKLGIIGLPWLKERELKDLRPIDIGIMPLPDIEWAKGKCGLKGLQYMALEIPTVMSSVGVNVDIIQDGKNGFLATTTEEWVEKISLLIEDGDLRLRLGKEGRKTVVENYSIKSQRENYVSVFNTLTGSC